jgi:hypothetical protein
VIGQPVRTALLCAALARRPRRGRSPPCLIPPSPGATNLAVTQATIGETVCVRGWTRAVRPPERYTRALKRHQIREYGYTDRRLGEYEEDHLIPFDLGSMQSGGRPLVG